MFLVRYTENNQSLAIEFGCERDADNYALHLRRFYNIMAYVECDRGEYRFYK